MSELPPPQRLLAQIGPQIADFRQRVCWVLEAHADLSISSWYRDPVKNRRVGGNPYSQHLIALAVDIVGDFGPGTPLEHQILEQFRVAGLTAVAEADHIHVQRYPAAANPLRTAGALQGIAGVPATEVDV